jgi:hypothetical protein
MQQYVKNRADIRATLQSVAVNKSNISSASHSTVHILSIRYNKHSKLTAAFEWATLLLNFGTLSIATPTYLGMCAKYTRYYQQRAIVYTRR